MAEDFLAGSLIGSIIIALAWALQLMSSWDGKRVLRKRFIILYNIGIATIIIDNFLNGNNLFAFFNIIIFVLSAIILAKIGKGDEIRIKKTNLLKRVVKKHK